MNVGYGTNFGGDCFDCNKETGGSIRLGLLTRGKWGFYVGYVWYSVEQGRPSDYEDSGSAILAGVDFLLLRRGFFEWYLQGGLAYDMFTSDYYNSNLTETETSIVPQLGVVFHYRKLNAYAGVGSSLFNVGLGFTLQ